MAADLLTAAIETAATGWPVFPLAPRGKDPLTDHGFKNASIDLDLIWWWWEKWPQANIGSPTGEPCGAVVLDVDGDTGQKSLSVVERQYEPLPATLTARSGRADGGRHHYFAYFRNDIRNSTGRIAPGLDVRGTGGYIVIPPSIHETGRPYAWERPIRRIAPMPAWLRALMLADPVKAAAATAPMPRPRIAPAASDDHASLVRRGRIYIAAVEGAGRGRRNISVFSLAGHLASLRGEHGDHLGEPEILALVDEYARRCDPPPDSREVARTVHSALTTGRPREPKPPRPRPQRLIPKYKNPFDWKGAA